MPDQDPHAYAVAAEENLERLATELARMGADDNTVNAISQMASVTRQVIKGLGRGQVETGDDEPPRREQPQAAPAPEDQAPLPDDQSGQAANFDEATAALQSAAQARAQQQPQPGR